MPVRRLLAIPLFTVLIVFGTAAYRAPSVLAGLAFQPPSADELKMTSEPLAPGAPAIILYRSVDRDDYGRSGHGGAILVGGNVPDADRFEDNYTRIKILTEEGRKYADVEIPIFNVVGTIGAINARTIHSDGTIVNFDGKVFDKVIAKQKGLSYLARTFTLPDVQVGSIIEYYYTVHFKGEYFYNSQWILSNELFTKKARFSLRPNQNDYMPISFRWSEQLPPGAEEPKQGPDGLVRLEASNIPAFQAEDFMPPQNELEERVDFIYSFDPFEMDPAKFWKKVGKKRNEKVEAFLNKRAAMEQAVAQIVSPSDAPEVKLQKIYARVQQLRNATYDVRKTEQEQQRDKEKPAENVDDIWKQGYGSETELNWLCLALDRVAGFEAYDVWLSDRRNFFFNPQTMDSGKLDANIVLVKLNGKDLFLDPGAALAPFGLLKWDETGVQGLRLDKDGGTWVQTTLPDSSMSRTERTAKLQLSDHGDLEGKLTVTYTGLQALRRRVEERNQDDTERKSFLENEIREYVPAAVEVDLVNQPEWKSSQLSLVAEFNLKISGWASAGGRRVLLPVGVFSAGEKRVFAHANRVHPIYMEFPSQQVDDVTIELPSGWQIQSLPTAQDKDVKAVAYSLKAENENGKLHLARTLNVEFLLLDPKYYGALRSFFQFVRVGDEEQAVLTAGASSASN